jgi:hypothetical protein
MPDNSGLSIRTMAGMCGGLFGAVIGLHVSRLHEIAWQITWGFQLVCDYRSMGQEFIVRMWVGVVLACITAALAKGAPPKVGFWTGLVASLAANLMIPSLYNVRE